MPAFMFPGRCFIETIRMNDAQLPLQLRLPSFTLHLPNRNVAAINGGGARSAGLDQQLDLLVHFSLSGPNGHGVKTGGADGFEEGTATIQRVAENQIETPA